MGAMRRATRLSARSLMYEGAIWSGWSGAACAPVCGCAHSVLVAGAPGLGGDGARFMSSYPNMMKRKKQRESKLESIDDIVKGLYKFYPGNEEEGEVDPVSYALQRQMLSLVRKK